MLYQLYNAQALLNFRCTEYSYRGTLRKVIIQSSKSKVHRTLNAFLQNSENKTRLISLIKEVLLRRRSDILKLLRSLQLQISKTSHMCTYLISHISYLTKSHISTQCFVRVFVLGWYTYFQIAQVLFSLRF